jgi:hypothetical protein
MTNQSNSMASRHLRVFLCHSSGDKPTVRKLYQRLQACNIDPWLDEENLLPGQNWEQEIRTAVRDTDVVIVCLSNGSINKKGFVQKEIKFALDVADEQPEGTIFLIPLRLEESEVPERLRSWHWVNYFKESGFDRLLMALKRRQESLSEKGVPIAIIDTHQVEEEERVRKAESEEKLHHQLQEEEQTLKAEEKRLHNLEEERRRRNEEAEQERIRQAEQIKSPSEVRGTIVPTSSPTPILSNQNSEQSTINVTLSPTLSLKQMNTNSSKLIKSSIWHTPFTILLGLFFILPIVGIIIAFNISQPYGSTNPNAGLDHAVELGLSVILILVAIGALWFVRNGTAIIILLLKFRLTGPT